ncbi:MULTISPECIES: 4-hydroxy-3-methylbut-2-enyl diphosphate reductase [Thiorhodovibrio]|uniref:4-hydroxy-3-methylbut-2-enyl diphosphate reductase n=1 Tax=Thiorhodovibrio TaxID=61593 RepID=UPI0019146A31|nr:MULTISPECIES: 4-hydroxy-3-methylbut-2-enyl diphosphate reductase [Thiorhodovibrio]MBK5968464.1 4-hydroxy-3-methylbut-2-enyl diphosphate reductase [Thiorhodovibrio winogradskyi]
MDVLLANPRGFCAGVDRAIAIVERVLEQHGAPLYVRHEVVHNRYIVESLKARGVIFIEDVAEVPEGAVCVFSAHGVSLDVRRQAEERNLQLYDATCPLVTKVHLEVARHCRDGADVVLIGHRGHPEVEGTMGQCPGGEGPGGEGQVHLIESVADIPELAVRDPNNVCYVTQTTLSVDDSRAMIDALKARFPALKGPKKSDICYATQNRQDAVRKLAADADLMLVVGSVTSSNSNRLRELAEKQGIAAYLIDGADEIDPQWLAGKPRVAVTAGASAPELLVQQVIERLRELGAAQVQECDGVAEEVVFALPKSLMTE